MLVFLVDSPFNQRDFERYGIDLLSQNGFEVEVWDLTMALNPHLAKDYNPPDPIDWSGAKVFRSKRNAFKRIRGLSSDTFVFNYVVYLPRSYGLYKAISKSRVQYAVHMANALPTAEIDASGDLKPSFMKRIRKLTGRGPFRLINSLYRASFYRIPYAYLGLKPVNLILAGGEDCFKYHYPTSEDTEILWVHTLDYDLYLEERDHPCEERPIAVFLDEYVPFHSDFTELNLKPPLTAEEYYPVVNRFLGYVERETGLKVVIAAHPRSQYEHHPDYYEGRECVRGKTVRLVRESRFVITHMSTALNFVNLYDKPVIFVTSSDWEQDSYWADVKVMASWFGKKPVYMNDDLDIDWEKELSIDTTQYQRYRSAYIKREGSDDLPFWQVAADRLKRGGFGN